MFTHARWLARLAAALENTRLRSNWVTSARYCSTQITLINKKNETPLRDYDIENVSLTIERYGHITPLPGSKRYLNKWHTEFLIITICIKLDNLNILGLIGHRWGQNDNVSLIPRYWALSCFYFFFFRRTCNNHWIKKKLKWGWCVALNCWLIFYQWFVWCWAIFVLNYI